MERQTTIWSYNPLVIFILAAGFLMLVPTFWSGLSELVLRWDKQEEYSHGYLIPLVTAYLIWQRRGLLKSLEFEPTWYPMVFVVIGMVIAVIGEISALYVLIHFSMILLIMSMAWTVMGWNAFRYVVIPLGLLVFAIPLPYFLEATLTADLQLISSKLGVAFIRLFGIPVYAEGNVIDLGVYQLQVVEACSGLRYLYPLMGVGFIIVYLYQVELWKRVLVFLSTIPITILMNSFRIGVIGILVDNWGIGMAEGFLHYFEGWIIFIACLVILLLEMWLLNKVGKRANSFSAVFAMPTDIEIPTDNAERRTREMPKPFIACMVMIAGSFFIVESIDAREEVIPERERFVTFPLFFEGWRGEQDNLETIVSEKLGLSDYILNNYSNGDGPPVNFYVAYYSSQRKGLTPHSPRVCIPGGGWSITGLERTSITLDGRSTPININRAVIQNGRHQQLVYYWFKQRGRDIANEYLMKWYLLSDSLTLNRTDGSLVRLTTPIAPGEKEADAEARLNQFLGIVDPKLELYIPS